MKIPNLSPFRKFRIFRFSIQIIFLYFLTPLFLVIFYCPYRLPWIVCDICSLFWCPAKYLRNPTIFLIGATAVFSGRTFCSFSCPFGTLQEFINAISRKISKRGDFLIKDKPLIKFFFLVVIFLMALDLASILNIFPLERLFLEVPLTYTWVPIILGIFLFLSVFVERFFCRFLCPLGALISIANKFSFLKLKLNEERCIKCEICKEACLMVQDKEKYVDLKSTDCIFCGNCLLKCPEKVINLRFRYF